MAHIDRAAFIVPTAFAERSRDVCDDACWEAYHRQDGKGVHRWHSARGRVPAMCRGMDERSRARQEKARALVTLPRKACRCTQAGCIARKLEAKERALDAAVREHEQDMRLYRLQLATSCVEWMVQYLEHADASEVQAMAGGECVCSPKHSVMCWACETKAERERLAESGYSLHF
jgi:hypothetical protein